MPACEAAGQQRSNALQPHSAIACISIGANTPNNVDKFNYWGGGDVTYLSPF